jgi:hypothetical protein
MRMRLLAVVVLAPALAFSLPGGASVSGSYHRSMTGPTTVQLSSCEYLGNPPECGVGLGAIIQLDGSWGDTDLNENGAGSADPAGGHVWAQGNCTVEFLGDLEGSFSFLCGIDRDGDGYVTHDDGDSSDPDGFDDDFASSNVPDRRGSVPVCFRAVGGSSSSTAGAAWGEMQVFIAANDPWLGAVGPFAVDVDLTTRATSCTIPNSGHSHHDWTPTPAGNCNGAVQAFCYYDHDDDPRNGDELCVVWQPRLARILGDPKGCLVGG